MTRKFQGLTSEAAELSREKHGSNSLERVKRRGFFRRFFDNLSDPIIRILVIALVLEVVFTLGNCNLVEVFGIIAAILIATVVSTLSECGSERAFEKLEAQSRGGKARVIRDGCTVEIPIDDVVVGDLLLLSAGESVHADGLMLDGTLTVDQSALNGENIEAHKRVGAPKGWDLSDEARVFRGSVVSSGEGAMAVIPCEAQTL